LTSVEYNNLGAVVRYGTLFYGNSEMFRGYHKNVDFSLKKQLYRNMPFFKHVEKSR